MKEDKKLSPLVEELTGIIPQQDIEVFIDEIENPAEPNQALKDAAERYQERSYSEEEVIEILQKALTHKDDGEIGSLVTAQGEIRPANFFSWFNKFKNTTQCVV